MSTTTTAIFQKQVVATLLQVSPQLAALHASRYQLLNYRNTTEDEDELLLSPLHCSRCGYLGASVRIMASRARRRGAPRTRNTFGEQNRRENETDSSVTKMRAQRQEVRLPSVYEFSSLPITQRKRVSVRSTCDMCGHVDIKPLPSHHSDVDTDTMRPGSVPSISTSDSTQEHSKEAGTGQRPDESTTTVSSSSVIIPSSFSDISSHLPTSIPRYFSNRTSSSSAFPFSDIDKAVSSDVNQLPMFAPAPPAPVSSLVPISKVDYSSSITTIPISKSNPNISQPAHPSPNPNQRKPKRPNDDAGVCESHSGPTQLRRMLENQKKKHKHKQQQQQQQEKKGSLAAFLSGL